MKLRLLVLLVCAALFAAVPAHAVVGSHSFGIEAGASVPSGDFGDEANTGFNVGANYQFMVNQFGVGGEVKYHSWGASDDMNTALETSFGSGSEATFSAWQYDAFGIMTMPMPNATPYVKFGAGWYAPAQKLTTPAGDENFSDTTFGIVAGAGVDFNVTGPVKFGIGANYHRLKDSEADFFSISARAMWPLNLGLTP